MVSSSQRRTGRAAQWRMDGCQTIERPTALSLCCVRAAFRWAKFASLTSHVGRATERRHRLSSERPPDLITMSTRCKVVDPLPPNSVFTSTMNLLRNISAVRLAQALQIKRRIEELEQELDRLITQNLGQPVTDSGSGRNRFGLTAAGRRNIAQAQKARWAKYRLRHPKPPKTGPKRHLSALGRARIIEAQRRRWVAFHAAQAA